MASSNDHERRPPERPPAKKDGEQKGWGQVRKAAPKPAAVPQAAPPPKPKSAGWTGAATAASAPPATAAPQRTATGSAIPAAKPRTASGVSMPAAGAPSTKVSSASSSAAIASAERLLNPVAAPPLPPSLSGARKLTEHQKGQLNSAFQDTERASKAQSVIGNTREGVVEREATPMEHFDGQQPAPGVSSRDLFAAIQPPAQSREGHRSAEHYLNVIRQFAVGNNPRYEPDAPDKGRAHIFVWDVSRAMHCELPHFVGTRELTLGQTVDWIRLEGPMRGWVRTTAPGALEAAQAGMLVVALPKDVKVKQVAVVLPEKTLASDMKPLVAAAGLKRGERLRIAEAMGVHAVEYFAHP